MFTNPNPALAQRFVVAQFVLFGMLFLMLVIFPVRSSGITQGVGLVLMLAGVGIITHAVTQHRNVNDQTPNVAPVPSDSGALVETGLYAQIRHPIYTGVMVGAFGAAVAHGDITAFLMAGALVVFFTLKSLYEEALLRQRYPDYADYMTRTGRFLPLWIDLSRTEGL